MKGIPKRLGEIVDLICREAGIGARVVPRSVALHKTEAISILQFIQSLKQKPLELEYDPTLGVVKPKE